MRGSLLWEASESLQSYLTFEHTRIRENGAPTVSGGVNDKAAFGTFGNAALASCAAININPGFPPGGPPSFPPPGVGTDGAPRCYGPHTFAGKFTSEGTFPVFSDLDGWGASGESTWTVNDWLTIKSITAYREMDVESSRDGDNTPANIFATQDFYEHEQFSEEVQFSGSVLDDHLKWLFGFYYFEEDDFNHNPVTLPVGARLSGGLYDNDSRAVFLQFTNHFTEKFAITFGARYTVDRKRFTPDQIALGDASQSNGSIFASTWPLTRGIYLSSTGPMPAGTRILLLQEFEQEFDDFNVMFNLAYDWTENMMTYVTYSEGFKSSGFDHRYGAPPIDAATGRLTNRPNTFEPETVNSYEIGMKSEWFDNSVRLNLAFFKTNYDNRQLIIRETFNPITFNGGSADIGGAEIELIWVPTER